MTLYSEYVEVCVTLYSDYVEVCVTVVTILRCV